MGRRQAAASFRRRTIIRMPFFGCSVTRCSGPCAPTNPQIHYHLGVAFLNRKDAMPLARSAAATTLPSLALFGASGTIGRRIAQEAVDRGATVTAPLGTPVTAGITIGTWTPSMSIAWSKASTRGTARCIWISVPACGPHGRSTRPCRVRVPCQRRRRIPQKRRDSIPQAVCPGGAALKSHKALAAPCKRACRRYGQGWRVLPVRQRCPMRTVGESVARSAALSVRAEVTGATRTRARMRPWRRRQHADGARPQCIRQLHEMLASYADTLHNLCSTLRADVVPGSVECIVGAGG